MKRLLAFALLLALQFVSSWPAAAEYPDRPVRLIIPFPPGGSNDVVGRLMANQLSEKLGHKVFVDNRGGLGPKHAACPAAIVDENLRPELDRKLLGDEPPDHVIAAARRERNDQPHRMIGIFGGRGRTQRQQQRQCKQAPHQAGFRSSTSIETPSGPRTKQMRTPGRACLSSIVNSAPLDLRSATTLSISFTSRPKWSSP